MREVGCAAEVGRGLDTGKDDILDGRVGFEPWCAGGEEDSASVGCGEFEYVVSDGCEGCVRGR